MQFSSTLAGLLNIYPLKRLDNPAELNAKEYVKKEIDFRI